MDILENKNQKNETKDNKNKLPFAVFVCPKAFNNEINDYKQVFTDIISDRIKEKYK